MVMTGEPLALSFTDISQGWRAVGLITPVVPEPEWGAVEKEEGSLYL